MKVICLIDSLNSGGAQRQLCMLAMGLKQLGFDVQIITYHQFDFFQPIVEKQGVSLKLIESKTKFHRILNIRRAIRRSNPDIVISYLNTPNLLAELSCIPTRNFGLIVSERNTEYGGIKFKSFKRFLFHLLADIVVTNSYAQENIIRRTAPWLRSRLITIQNCVDLKAFYPRHEYNADHFKKLRILVVARFEPQKNPIALLSAIEILIKKNKLSSLSIDWFGNNFSINGKPTSKSLLYLNLKKEIERRSLTSHFRVHPPEEDVLRLYHQATVLCLPSLYEGCSNVIVEAMACGLPVLASHVGDNPLLIEEGVNGYLFSPDSPQDIANTILRFISLSPEERVKMGQQSRRKAEEFFSYPNFLEKYKDLFSKIRGHKGLQGCN